MAKYYDAADVMRSNPTAKIEPADLSHRNAIKSTGQSFFDMLNALPPSREMSLAKTKLEEAIMWAIKGITA